VSSLTQPSSFDYVGVSLIPTEREEQMARQINTTIEKIQEMEDDLRMVKE